MTGSQLAGSQPRAADPRATRRSTVLMALVLAVVATLAMALLSACGSDDSTETTDPVAVSGKFGEAKVDGMPERVLPLSPQDTDFVLGAGVTPIAVPVYPDTLLATEGTGIWPWQREALGDANPEQLQLAEDAGQVAEHIAALKPDVIVATGFWSLDQQVYDKLSAIAPVVHFDTMANGEPWQDSQRKVGKALGHQAQAEKAVTDAEGRLSKARDDHPEFAKKTYNAVIGDMNNQLYVLSAPDRGIGMVISALGLELDPDVRSLRTDSDGRGLLGYEEIPRLDADVVFVVSPAGDTGYLTDRPAWQDTKAAKEGHVVSLPRNSGVPSAAGFPSPLSIGWCIDKLTPLISQVVGA